MTIEQQLERLLGAVNVLADVSEQNTRDLSTVRESVGHLANIAEQHQQGIEVHQQALEQHQRNFDAVIGELQRQGTQIQEMQTEVREMQSQVRGLQTENRRILDRLFGSDGDQG